MYTLYTLGSLFNAKTGHQKHEHVIRSVDWDLRFILLSTLNWIDWTRDDQITLTRWSKWNWVNTLSPYVCGDLHSWQYNNNKWWMNESQFFWATRRGRFYPYPIRPHFTIDTTDQLNVWVYIPNCLLVVFVIVFVFLVPNHFWWVGGEEHKFTIEWLSYPIIWLLTVKWNELLKLK